MATVYDEFSKTFQFNGEEVRVIIQLDHDADDAEGHGVVIGDENTDQTVAFGQGDMGDKFSQYLFKACVREVEQCDDKNVEELECFNLETLYDFEEQAILTSDEHFKELHKITTYITKWLDL